MPTEATDPRAPVKDGRVLRGQERRRLLLAAVLRVIEREGVAAVTHRVVAAEAGVLKSVATYHFPAIDDLLIAALTDSAEEYAAEFRQRVTGECDLGELTDQLVAYLNEHRARCVAEYELYLHAARRPELRPAALRWSELTADIARMYTHDPAAIEAFVAVANGISLQSLVRDEPLDAAEVRAIVAQILPGRALRNPLTDAELDLKSS